MNLVERLMLANSEDLRAVETKEVEVKRLSELLGEKTTITVKAISGERYTEIASIIFNKKGGQDFSKVYTMKLLLVCEGTVEPNLKDKGLQKHFGCATPKDLAELLFRGQDLNRLSDEITKLSGYDDDSEEDVKN